MSDDLERIPDKLAEFELMVQRYNMTSGETLSGQVEKATIPDTARTSQVTFVGQCSTIANGAEVRTAVRDYLMARREWRPPTAMTREREQVVQWMWMRCVEMVGRQQQGKRQGQR